MCVKFSTGMWVPNIPEKFTGIEHAEVQETLYRILHDTDLYYRDMSQYQLIQLILKDNLC